MLEAVLQLYGNAYSSVPLAHSVHMKKSYENMDQLLSLLDYKKSKWHVCGDLKVIGLVLGMQPGYTKVCCFLYERNNRNETNHFVCKHIAAMQVF